MTEHLNSLLSEKTLKILQKLLLIMFASVIFSAVWNCCSISKKSTNEQKKTFKNDQKEKYLLKLVGEMQKKSEERLILGLLVTY